MAGEAREVVAAVGAVHVVAAEEVHAAAAEEAREEAVGEAAALQQEDRARSHAAVFGREAGTKSSTASG